MDRRRCEWLLVLVLALAAPAAVSGKNKDPERAERGSLVRESVNAEIVETATGDSFARFDERNPVRLRLTGPARFQADFRIVLQADERPTAVLSAFADGKAIQAYRIPAKPGGGDWKNGQKASVAVGFLVEVPEGTQLWEFRVKGATPHGAALLVVPAEKARRRLAPSAPVLKAPSTFASAATPPPPASTASAAASAARSPAPGTSPAATATVTTSPAPSAARTPEPIASPAPVAASSPVPAASPATTPVEERSRRASVASGRRLAVEAGAVGYVRWAEKVYDPVAPGITVAVLRPTGIRLGPGALALGASIGWRHHTGGRTFGEYRGRILAPYIADVDAVPLEAVGRWTTPAGPVELVAQAGAGLEYARSSFVKADETPRRWREPDWAITASTSLGAQRGLMGGRAGVRVGARFARHAFAAHDLELLHGVEATLSFQKSF